MDFLPKEIEDIIIDYKTQLEYIKTKQELDIGKRIKKWCTEIIISINDIKDFIIFFMRLIWY